MKKRMLLFAALFLVVSMLAGCGRGLIPIKTSVPDTSEELTSDAYESETALPTSEETSEDDDIEIDPEDGEPFMGGFFSEMVGNITIDAEWIPFETPLVVDDIFDATLAVAGDAYYIITDGEVKEYSLIDDEFVLQSELDLDDDYEGLCADNNGVLYLSGFMEDFIGFRDNTQIFSHDGPDMVAMHPSGEWGISWFSGPDVEVIKLDDGTLETDDWTFEEVGNINSLNISENYIFISGPGAENKEQSIFVYDFDGDLELTLGGTAFGEPDSLGSVTVTVETSNGFMALDGNMRNLCFWKPDGTFIGTIEDGDLFGTSYPWLSTAVPLADGSILVGMTEERADESADEFIVYRLTGF